MNRLIVLCGYPGTGKDAIAEFLCENHNFVRVAFADPVREALYALNPIIVGALNWRLQYIVDRDGWDKAKRTYTEIRDLLQKMGTEVGRNVHGPNCWTDIAARKISKAFQGARNVVITDCRFHNEIAFLKKYPKRLILHIERPGYGKINEHSSEQLDYREVADGTICNNSSLFDLYDVVKSTIFDE
jgi:hypothetical protein